MVVEKSFQEIFSNIKGLGPRVSKVRKLLVSLGIGQYKAMEIVAVKWNVVWEISKVLLNDILQNLMEAKGLRILLM